VQPVNFAWHLKRFDTWIGYAFTAPTGKFFPLALNNVGSGYWGNNVATGTTFYVTKNKGTSLNLATNWEFHGQKRTINITPGQAFTDEWGLGQIIPLKKDLSILAQAGVVGYDQWQVSANQGLKLRFRITPYMGLGPRATSFFLPKTSRSFLNTTMNTSPRLHSRANNRVRLLLDAA
jgi:hypothetical protein